MALDQRARGYWLGNCFKAGGVGLWCKPNNVTYFDNLTVAIDK